MSRAPSYGGVRSTTYADWPGPVSLRDSRGISRGCSPLSGATCWCIWHDARPLCAAGKQARPVPLCERRDQQTAPPAGAHLRCAGAHIDQQAPDLDHRLRAALLLEAQVQGGA